MAEITVAVLVDVLPFQGVLNPGCISDGFARLELLDILVESLFVGPDLLEAFLEIPGLNPQTLWGAQIVEDARVPAGVAYLYGGGHYVKFQQSH